MSEILKKYKEYRQIKEQPSEYEIGLFSKAQKYIKYISWISGLKFVGVCNSLSRYSTQDEDSDIDLFIITAPNRLWFVRVLVTGIFQILGVRRYGNKVKGRFCLSFFITENAMDFSKIAIDNDIYLLGFWHYYLKPILNKDNTYERFIETNFGDYKYIIPRIEYIIEHKTNIKPSIEELKNYKNDDIYNNKTFRFSKDYGEYDSKYDNSKVFNFLNNFFKKIFLPRALKKKEKLGNPYGIIVSDDILKFHDNDKRIEIRDYMIND